MILNKIMLNIYTKWTIDLGHKEGHREENDGSKQTKYEARQVRNFVFLW